MEKLAGRIPPHDTEAEKSVLGTMLLDKEAIYTAIEILRAEDFYLTNHGDIFSAILSLFNASKPVDHILLTDELRKKGRLDAVGGLEYILELTSPVVLAAHIRSYCEIVKEKSIYRQLIRAGDKILGDAYTGEMDATQVMENAEKMIFQIAQSRTENGLRHLKQVTLEAFERMIELSKSGRDITGVTTGYRDLDNYLSGMQATDLILLAARPSMGKTALGINIATNAAKSGAKVAVFSLEMNAVQLSQRIVSSISKVDLSKIISGKLEGNDWDDVGQASDAMVDLDIYIDDTASISLSELRAKCRRMKLEKGLDLIVIDYLQLMVGDVRSENRQQEISTISRGLKALAKEVECPVLALSQLSRSTEKRTDKIPILSDLRESGAIEQDADVVMFIHRDAYYDKEAENTSLSKVIIAKHRNGPTGMIEMVFLPEYTTFAEKAREIV